MDNCVGNTKSCLEWFIKKLDRACSDYVSSHKVLNVKDNNCSNLRTFKKQ